MNMFLSFAMSFFVTFHSEALLTWRQSKILKWKGKEKERTKVHILSSKIEFSVP
jgi:hypothetical protein